MKRKIILTLFYTYFIMTLFSCQSLLKVLKTDYSVPVTEDFETVKEKADRIIAEKDYIKKFNTSDKAGRKHTVIFLDTEEATNIFQISTLNGTVCCLCSTNCVHRVSYCCIWNNSTIEFFYLTTKFQRTLARFLMY